MLHAALRLALFASLSVMGSAQETLDLQAALGAWQETHGSAWRAESDPQRGQVRFLYGGRTAAAARLHDDRAALLRARDLISEAAKLLGIDPATLVEDGALFLPLSNAGSSDKYTANFHQRIGGLRVVGASVHVLMDLDGRGLSIDSTALSSGSNARTAAIREGVRVREQAERTFLGLNGSAGLASSDPRLVIDVVVAEGSAQGRLAWEIEVFGQGDDGVPRGLLLRLADDDLSLTSREELVHRCDVSGNVATLLTPGVLPDIPTNPTIQLPLAHVQVQSAQGSAVTDANGNFNIVGATAPLNVSVSFDGPFTTSTNAQVPVYVSQVTLASPSGNAILMNSPAQALYTAEANSMYWIGRMRDFVRGVNPADATADFDATSNLNQNSTCNAFYNGNSVTFFSAGGGCVNTAYSTVVAHEMGHWFNARYSSGNGADGFGEGNADTWATYLTDQPIVGENFFGGGGNIRSGLNTRMFCGDANGGCYGGVHADGEVLMGALWKLRVRLKNSLGASAGSMTADLLFSSWMNAYNDGQIKTIVRTHWLVLDDDDGDIDNGTPHYTDIDQGFADQGFPLYVRKPVSLSNVTQLANTIDQVGPYVVTAKASANLAPPIALPRLFWRSNGGAFQQITMSAMGGNQFSGAIPGQISPAKIEYYVSASDAQSATAFFPTGAPATLQRFAVGDERIFYSDTFEGVASTWTTGASSGAVDWHFETPRGKGGDPQGPRTGVRCWGTDLGLGNGDGLYSANSSNWIQSPLINLVNCPRPILRLQRWLTVEGAPNDTARIVVNGQVLWQNPAGADLIDSAWTEMELDLTAVAAGHPNTTIRFELSSDGQVERGGWNVDDIQIVTRAAVGQGCVDPQPYCVGKMNSLGWLPTLRSTGAPSAALPNLAVELREGVPNRPGILLRSSAGPNATPFSGGTLCLAPPVVRHGTFLTDVFGYAHMPIAVNAGMAGQTWYLQAWYRDSASSFGVGLSDGLQVKFCP